MAHTDDSSNPKITIIPPPDSSEQVVRVQYQGPDWWQLPPTEFIPREGLASGPESYRLRSPFHNTPLPLTGGDPLSLPASPDAAQYGPVWGTQDTLPSSSFGVEEIDDTGSSRLKDFSLSLDVQVQWQSDGHRPTQNTFLADYPPAVDASSPTNQRPATPYYTPPDCFLQLPPLSPVSPLASTPSPTSSFSSTLPTTPEGELNRVFTGEPYPDHDLYKITGQARGRPLYCERPTAPPPSMPSPYEQQLFHLPPSLQDPRSFGHHLDVPSHHSALWETNPPYNSSYCESTDPNVVCVIGSVDCLTIGPDPPSPIALPPSPSNGRGPGQVASEAIIAACRGRRKRKAKFKCDICPQTFTAKHNLINHQKAHKGIRDQVCPFCRNAFTASGTLTRHTKTCRGKSTKRVG